MSVVDENTPTRLQKYDYMLYVEFLEMICRIALIGLNISDLIEYKVELLLEILYNQQYKLKFMNPMDNPFKRVDEKFKHYKV